MVWPYRLQIKSKASVGVLYIIQYWSATIGETNRKFCFIGKGAQHAHRLADHLSG